MRNKWVVPFAIAMVLSSAASALYAEEQMMTAEGSVASLDLKSPAPSLKLTSMEGKSWTFTLDPKSTSLWEGKQEVKNWETRRRAAR